MYPKIVISTFFLLFMSCQQKMKNALPSNPDQHAKINFDLTMFDEDGLYGPEDGKRAMDYEFCIPQEAVFVEQIEKIDQNITIHKKSKGRIQCSTSQYLCIGNTHQEGFKEVLLILADLDFVDRIDPTYFE